MKRIILLVALLAFGLSASAQTMKVQSAYADLKNNRLANAKKNIDAACEHENTKNDAKTWHYAGLIYAKIVEVSQTDEKLFKKQKIQTPVPELAEISTQAIIKSLDLEKAASTTEYMKANINTLKYIVGYQFANAFDDFDKGGYAQSIPMFENVSKVAQIAVDDEIRMKNNACLALAYDATGQKDKAAELYRQLVRQNTKEEAIYINLFLANKRANENDKAINVLKAGVKNLPANYKLLGLLSGAYIENGNKEEADKCIAALKAMADTISHDKPNVLVIIGNALRDANNTEEAIPMYNKSLELNPNQTDANLNLGILYFNWAVDLKDQADKLPIEAAEAYDKLQVESKSKFSVAIPYFEKVLTQKPNDIRALNALKVIYSRLEMKEKYQEVSAKLESLRNK
ncbi:MAG: tetratricopeptide repeat protein [Bacteroidales bacterium]|jgi:tetratricopeptide (TPR) repeat protein|nr:tetratricopeptide repeat protein [Bacteroidales bacterium]